MTFFAAGLSAIPTRALRGRTESAGMRYNGVMAIELPPAFHRRMRALLASEAGDFLASLRQPASTGLRLNTLKLERASPLLDGWGLQAVPWCKAGYVLTNEAIAAGRHPYHAAGFYYLQDPSAMAAAVLLDPQPGELVLDLAAAPGGKATHLAAAMRGRGLLVANEVVRSRAAALIENLERLGVDQVLVLSERVETLAAHWPDRFDRVLLDAPCSGEGMFRKNPAAVKEWRPEIVSGCALRQAHILDDAARLVRPGGRLLYATCTFAPEENEANVAAFLRDRPDFQLLDPPRLPGFSPGRPDWIDPALARGLALERCVRIWPQHSPGEGHFYALFEREGTSEPAPHTIPFAQDPLPTAARQRLYDFWQETLHSSPPAGGWAQYGDWLHRLPVAASFWGDLRPLRAGLRLGRLAKHRFEPHHAFALTLAAQDVQRSLELQPGTAEMAAYLRGETLATPGQAGWVLATAAGWGLGWGKRTGAVLKNHLPKSWRIRSAT